MAICLVRTGKAKMAKRPKSLEAIRAERSELDARMKELRRLEKEALEAERDAGRAPLIAALERIKIAAMSQGEAKAIAKAIADHGSAKVVAALSSLGTAS